MANTTPAPDQLVPQEIATELIKEHGQMEFKTGEFCFDNMNKCFDRVTPNYAKVSKGVGIVVYKKTHQFGKYNHINTSDQVVTTLLLSPGTRVGLGGYYTTEDWEQSYKCRADQAVVLDNATREKNKPLESTHSTYDQSFTYKVGCKVTPKKPFEDNTCFNTPESIECKYSSYQECESGIHLFMPKIDAILY